MTRRDFVGVFGVAAIAAAARAWPLTCPSLTIENEMEECEPQVVRGYLQRFRPTGRQFYYVGNVRVNGATFHAAVLALAPPRLWAWGPQA